MPHPVGGILAAGSAVLVSLSVVPLFAQTGAVCSKAQRLSAIGMQTGRERAG